MENQVKKLEDKVKRVKYSAFNPINEKLYDFIE